MKKLVILLFIISIVVPFSFGKSGGAELSNISSIIEDPDFRGIWKVVDEGIVTGYQIIWIDEKGNYEALYMLNNNKVTKTLRVSLKDDKLIIRTVFLENNWKAAEVLTLLDENTISVEGTNEDESYSLTLERLEDQN